MQRSKARLLVLLGSHDPKLNGNGDAARPWLARHRSNSFLISQLFNGISLAAMANKGGVEDVSSLFLSRGRPFLNFLLRPPDVLIFLVINFSFRSFRNPRVMRGLYIRTNIKNSTHLGPNKRTAVKKPMNKPPFLCLIRACSMYGRPKKEQSLTNL